MTSNNQEVFTDEDLKEWHKRLDPQEEGVIIYPPVEKERALLARLEAAEQCYENCAHINSNQTGCPYCEAWRKAAGK